MKDFYTVQVQTDNTDYLSNIFVSADYFSKNTAGLCATNATASRKMYDVISSVAKTIPDLTINQQNVKQTSTKPMTWNLLGRKLVNGSSLITFDVTMNYASFIAGNAYQFTTSLKTNPVAAFTDSLVGVTSPFVRWTIQIDGQVVYDKNINTTTDLSFNTDSTTFGLTINNPNPIIRFTVTVPRPLDNVDFSADVSLNIDEFTTVYNPITDCC
jgi:hypothetical protein